MADIIARAKKITGSELYPSPWEFVESAENQYGDWDDSRLVASNGEDIAYDIEDTFGKVLASIPELAEALAEEEWEYGVEYTGVNHGNRHIQWCYGEYDETSFDEVQWEYEKMLKRDMKPRMVRRRVSPKEYIEFGAPGRYAQHNKH